MITIQDLVIGYQNVPLSSEINGEIVQGSLTAIVGSNGCGKSTLSKTLCGLLPSIKGHITSQFELHKQLAWLPQHSHIDRDFPINVYEVVAMGCWPRKGIIDWLSSDKKKVFAALEQVGITHLAAVSINSLSGGEFQRMLFARMLVQDLPIMLMDEPFAGIDEQTQQLLLSLIIKLHQQGKTIIAVLHDSAIVTNTFTHVIEFERQDDHQQVNFSQIKPIAAES